jgi:site-specific recombinase XerD
MLERYFVKPSTVDRIRGSWIAPAIEDYVAWIAEHGYAARVVHSRVPMLVTFGEFARDRGAKTLADLPVHIDAFIAHRVAERASLRADGRPGPTLAKDLRGPIEQMLGVALPGFVATGRRQHPIPFASAVPGFFTYLLDERGLRPASIEQYRFHLDRFEAYLDRVGVRRLQELSPVLLSSFVVERASSGLARSTVRDGAGVLRVFLRFAHREGLLARDLSDAVGWPQVYRLASVPRSISWEDVNKVLAGVDRRTVAGRRDYAILLLLVVYGLRGGEIAALTLDDIDWKRERLAIPERKAGHSTAFPFTATVGEVLIAYLKDGRPETDDRHLFFRAFAPLRPIGPAAVSGRARHYLLKAGIDVPRPGSHTLRHTTVQRLVDADFDLKTIGDFIGHRSAASTEIYAKVAVEALREVALGDGEAVLG